MHLTTSTDDSLYSAVPPSGNPSYGDVLAANDQVNVVLDDVALPLHDLRFDTHISHPWLESQRRTFMVSDT